MKYKNQIELLKLREYNLYFQNNNNVHYRLFNGYKSKRDYIDKLSQKYLFDEAKKYTYFPIINEYDFIIKKYYAINSEPSVYNNEERKNNNDTNFSNYNFRFITCPNEYFKKKNKKKIRRNYNDINNLKNIKTITQKNTMTNYNFTPNNIYYNSLIKNKLNIFNKIRKKEDKNKVNKSTKLSHYYNRIPKNYIKYNKTSFNNQKASKSFCEYNFNSSNFNLVNKYIEEKNGKKQKLGKIKKDFPNYFPSSFLQKETDENLITKINNSYQSSDIINEEKSTKNNSKKNTLSLNNFQYDLISYNSNYIPNDKILHTIGEHYEKSNIKSYSYKDFPKNEYLFNNQRKTTYISRDSNNKNKNCFNKNIFRNRMSFTNNYKCKQSSIVLENNSLSTNFIDKPSQNEIYNSFLNENIQNSLINSKYNKNISYLFPSKDSIINITNNSNEKPKINDYNYIKNKIANVEKNKNEAYFKKINKSNINIKNKSKINKKILNKKFLKNNNDFKSNKISYRIPFSKNNENNKEKFNFKINEETNMDKNYILRNLKVASGVVNENIKNINNLKNGNNIPSSRRSETTIQSMSDSKIYEISKYYLNQEEAVDKIEITDILASKNNKNKLK